MSDTEVAFRAALHEEQFSTAAVLLAQLISARYSQQPLTLVQDIQLQRTCLDLLNQRSVSGAEALIKAAGQWQQH
ncbi:hypothetical protein HNQ93_002503 [Hymenobacter luteus]|uniref:Uncharacterized protein n=2 Tax=Hymenobacter TaxID=89966 RepID=A0A7W9T2R4_9BACT|nr:MULTISPECIES: hypothetical protein [Hymenobacter]MBB4601928.1 hypothetical protein [Hymenobacter latericoloratus]MBB6059643.1 hypothetical protein [Hymenobacter luteus]